MEVSYSNELSQKQALNAQLLHSLSILRMNAQELRDYIHTLSLENPMVELVTPPQRATPASADCPASSGALPDLRHSQTLMHELQAQAMSLPCSRPVRQMLELLIHSVNDSGYLSAPLEELTPAYCPAETAQQALRLLQQMEPAGVGARNLSECILLQLQRLPDSSLACKIAGSALPLLAEKQTAAVQSAGFEKFKTVMSKVNSVINLVGVWLFRLRKFIMAAPVVYAAIRLASYNGQHLPEQVGLDLQSTGEFAMTVSRQLAVMGPLGLTAACLLLMFCSRKAMYPWAISIFTLALPVLLLVSNVYPN